MLEAIETVSYPKNQGGIKMSKYLSPEWCAEATKMLREQLTAERMNHATASLSNIYKNCPDGKEWYLFIRFDKGNIAAFETGSGIPPEAEFKIVGNYDVFAQISRAEMNSQKALMTGKLSLTGNMAKAMGLTPVMDRFNKVLAQVPTEF